MYSSVMTVHPAAIASYAPAASSSASISLPAKPLKRTVAAKRKRLASEDDSGDSAAHTPGMPFRDGPKKKKANRACVHCQKSHLTCDDARPCQRCVKRGMADNCTEGHRKKAKYLLDDEELELRKSKAKGSETPATTPAPVLAPPPPDNAPLPTSEPFPANDPLFNLSFDPSLAFGSEAANLEYSILSAILGNPSSDGSLDGLDSHARGSPEPYDLDTHAHASPEPYATGLLDGGASAPLGPAPGARTADGSPEPYMQGLAHAVFSPLPTPLALPPAGADAGAGVSGLRLHGGAYAPYPFARADSPVQLAVQPSQTTLDGRARGGGGGQAYFAGALKGAAALKEREREKARKGASARGGLLSPPLSQSSASPRSSSAALPAPGMGANGLLGRRGTVYERVTAPYDYTEGYHALMKHLPARFEKNDILRIVRALAIVRPSLIALQMPLSEEDEVFVEKCFQRSLLEFEKLISFSGTPTVAWRRTGEICLVGAEFCMLSEWSRDELVGGKKYIWELFENSSVVEYWENFASHAFENTTQSVYSHSVLLKPSGAPVPCTFCFSIRKDIFDLPSLVIGQWLPLL